MPLRVSERRNVSIPAENGAKPTVVNGPVLAFHMGVMVREPHAPATPPIVVTINVDEVIEESFPAAIEAVRQWRYSPLLLNGKPERFVLTEFQSEHLGIFTTPGRFTHGFHDRQRGTAILSGLYPEIS